MGPTFFLYISIRIFYHKMRRCAIHKSVIYIKFYIGPISHING